MERKEAKGHRLGDGRERNVGRRVCDTDLCEKVPFHILLRAESICATVDLRSFSLDRQGQAGSGNGGSGPCTNPLALGVRKGPRMWEMEGGTHRCRGSPRPPSHSNAGSESGIAGESRTRLKLCGVSRPLAYPDIPVDTLGWDRHRSCLLPTVKSAVKIGTRWEGASHGASCLLEKQHKETSPIQMTRQSAGVLVLIVRGL